MLISSCSVSVLDLLLPELHLLPSVFVLDQTSLIVDKRPLNPRHKNIDNHGILTIFRQLWEIDSGLFQ